MWSDPEEIAGWAISPRGAGYLFGASVTQEVSGSLFLQLCYSYIPVTCTQSTTQFGGGYNHWTGLLDWTIGLTRIAKYTLFGAELIHSVTLLTLLPTASFLEFLEVKGHMHIPQMSFNCRHI